MEISIYPSPPYFFYISSAKILISNNLRIRDTPDSPQNLEPYELMRKIFQNKELAREFSSFGFSEPEQVRALAAGNWLEEPSHISSSLRLSPILGQGCSSQELEFFLWKAVENRGLSPVFGDARRMSVSFVA